MDLSKFAAGSYQLTGYTKDGFSKTIKFVKQQKLQLDESYIKEPQQKCWGFFI